MPNICLWTQVPKKGKKRMKTKTVFGVIPHKFCVDKMEPIFVKFLKQRFCEFIAINQILYGLTSLNIELSKTA